MSNKERLENAQECAERVELELGHMALDDDGNEIIVRNLARTANAITKECIKWLLWGRPGVLAKTGYAATKMTELKSYLRMLDEDAEV